MRLSLFSGFFALAFLAQALPAVDVDGFEVIGGDEFAGAASTQSVRDAANGLFSDISKHQEAQTAWIASAKEMAGAAAEYLPYAAHAAQQFGLLNTTSAGLAIQAAGYIGYGIQALNVLEGGYQHGWLCAAEKTLRAGAQAFMPSWVLPTLGYGIQCLDQLQSIVTSARDIYIATH